MHIAICDDCAHDRKSLCRALQAFLAENGQGAEIDSIEDGAVLLAMEPELLSEVELFFLDIYMERSNGFDVARALRTRGVAAPIVFLTSSPDFAVQSYEVEAFSYLLKPVLQDKLKALMQRFLQGYQPRSIFLAGRLFVQEEGASFLRCHQSYLVNLRYVCGLENETFITNLDRPVLIRKRDFPELRKRYYDYLKSVAGVGGSL